MGGVVKSVGQSLGIGESAKADTGNVDAALSNLQNRQNTWQGILDQQLNQTQQTGAYTDSALNLLQSAATGQQPSQAQAVLQQGLDQSIAQQMAVANSGNMATQLASQRNAVDAGAMLSQQAANQASALRAQEMAAAREGFAGTASNILGQRLGAQGTTMGEIGGLAGQQAGTATNMFNTQQQAQTELSGRFAKLLGKAGDAGAMAMGMPPGLSSAGSGGAITGGMLPGQGSSGTDIRSSEKLKENKEQITDGETSDKIKNMRIEKWDYKEGIEDEGTHVGAYAEEFQKNFGLGDGQSIKFQDAIGVTMKAVQDLAKNMDMLEKMISEKDKKKKD